MFYLKILDAGWSSFHGDLAGYQFQDGVSVDPLPRHVCDRLSGLLRTELLDSVSQEALGQGGPAARLAARRELATEVTAPLATMSDADKAEEQRLAVEQGADPSKLTIYTEEQLEQIASLQGITGLREVATPWNVKDRSIQKLIKLILKAQDNYLALVEERKEEERRQRAAAGDEAIRLQLEAEQKLFEQSRVLTQDTTPNAVDADGQPIHVTPVAQPEFTAAPNVDETEKVQVDTIESTEGTK